MAGLPEITYVHHGGQLPITFRTVLGEDSLSLSTEAAFVREERVVPLRAIDSLVWGRNNLIYVNWQDGDQFRQSTVMGPLTKLDALVEAIKGARPGLRVDESSRHITENKLAKIALITLLVAIGLPMAAFRIAVYLGYIPDPWLQ